MSIIYTLISRGTTVFCEHTGERGNFQQVTRTILEKIDASEDAKHSYSYGDYTFHMVVDGGLIYLAMSSKDLERSVAFGFLEDLKSEFDQRYSEIVATAVAFEMNKTFAKVLTDKMDFFNQRAAEVGAGGVGAGEDKEVDGGGDKIKKVRGEIEEVKQVMTDNIERILDRGDKIELLVDKSQQLTEQASKFKKSSTQLKKKMWWSNVKMQALLVCFVTTIIIIIILPATKCFGFC